MGVCPGTLYFLQCSTVTYTYTYVVYMKCAIPQRGNLGIPHQPAFVGATFVGGDH
jgi:hypothetical protein